MTMKQDQIKYVRARAEAILAQKKQTLRNKYTTSAKTMTNDEKLEALANGDFSVSRDGLSRDSYGRQWYQNVQFTNERVQQFDQDAYDKEINVLITAYNKLLDELMLGDNTQALALLQAFEGLA